MRNLVGFNFEIRNVLKAYAATTKCETNSKFK